MPFDPERLRAIRKKRGLTHQELADRVGVKRPRVQEYEGKAGKKKVRPGADSLEKLVNALDTNMDYLMGRSNFDGKRTPEHDAIDAAYDRGDINAILALFGKVIREQEPPEKRAAGRSPRTKKKLTLRG